MNKENILFIYKRHQPEDTLLYKIIEEHYPAFVSHLAEQGRVLPSYVSREFEEYLKCGLLAHGFLRVRCECCQHEKLVAFSCKKRGFCPSCCAKRMTESSTLLVDTVLPDEPMRQWVLSFPYPLRLVFARQPHVMSHVLKIVNRTISRYLIKKAGLTKKTARTGAVTLIQCFGSALNLNVHFHMLFLDGVYVDDASEKNGQRFVSITNHFVADIVELTHKISLRVARLLERSGLIESDGENTYLAAEGLPDNNEMIEHQSHSITYRIAVGPQKGKKIFSLQTLPPTFKETESAVLVGKVAGFSLHAGISVKAGQRDKLERLCRYISRPPVSVHRLSLTKQGKIRYELKTPYSNGTTHMIFEPLDFISKLAALVPMAGANLTRFHGVFVPNSQYRAQIIKRPDENKASEQEVRTESEKRAAMTWAQRLKRAFSIDIEICEVCGGKAKAIACIVDPVVINKILKHLNLPSFPSHQVILPAKRAPPVFMI